MRSCGLYIHIPFCLQKCAYCDFYSLSTDEATKTAYIQALTLHMKRLSQHMEDVCIDTVYIGGGTPGLLSPKQMTDLLDAMHASFYIHPQAEISMETNPAADAAATLSAARNGGVNRLSVGLQSVHDIELQTLGRLHRIGEFADTLKSARAVGFENISVDLMYGIPHQSVESLIESIDRLSSYHPTHISLYGLRVEEETPFGRMGEKLTLPNEDDQCEMYERAVEQLSAYGYHRYEISNFEKDGNVCRHNLRYWQRGEYIGLGPGAHSFFDGVRYSYPRSINHYITRLAEGELPSYEAYDALHAEDIENERIMLGLRLECGIEADDALLSDCMPYIRGGFMWNRDHRIGFTTKGFLVSNVILASIIK